MRRIQTYAIRLVRLPGGRKVKELYAATVKNTRSKFARSTYLGSIAKIDGAWFAAASTKEVGVMADHGPEGPFLDKDYAAKILYLKYLGLLGVPMIMDVRKDVFCPVG